MDPRTRIDRHLDSPQSRLPHQSPSPHIDRQLSGGGSHVPLAERRIWPARQKLSTKQRELPGNRRNQIGVNLTAQSDIHP